MLILFLNTGQRGVNDMPLINIDKDAALEIYREVVKEHLEEEGLIGSIWKMERMQREVSHGTKWIKEHIIAHPYVQRNELCFYDGKEWCFHAKRIIEFIDVYFPELKKIG
ncbi:DUF771 domain-containing protein [Listeria monocytogenes]|nr:DUF771 domain-containing protein [Listeria monocytogenes]EAF4337020.1 DUF771 domain-containing protein [Listeria monocytogenes]